MDRVIEPNNTTGATHSMNTPIPKINHPIHHPQSSPAPARGYRPRARSTSARPSSPGAPRRSTPTSTTPYVHTHGLLGQVNRRNLKPAPNADPITPTRALKNRTSRPARASRTWTRTAWPSGSTTTWCTGEGERCRSHGACLQDMIHETGFYIAPDISRAPNHQPPPLSPTH